MLTSSARAAICVLAGDGAGARLAGEEARDELEAQLRERADDVGALSQLRWVYLALGRHADALRVARQTTASLPIEKDAYWGPTFEVGLAENPGSRGRSARGCGNASPIAGYSGRLVGLAAAPQNRSRMGTRSATIRNSNNCSPARSRSGPWSSSEEQPSVLWQGEAPASQSFRARTLCPVTPCITNSSFIRALGLRPAEVLRMATLPRRW